MAAKNLYTTHKMKIEKNKIDKQFSHTSFIIWEKKKKKRSPSSNIFEMNIWNKRIFTLNHFTAKILDDNDNFLVELKGIKELNWQQKCNESNTSLLRDKRKFSGI